MSRDFGQHTPGRRLWRWGWALLGFVLLGSPRLLLAHGGGAPQLVNTPAGPYVISAWTTPDPPGVGSLHVTVALALATNPEPITAARVSMTATSAGEGAVLSAEASHEDALTPYFYEADLNLPTPGLWQIQVIAAGVEGRGEASFDLDVRPAASRNTPVLAAAAAMVLLVAAIAIQRTRQRSRV